MSIADPGEVHVLAGVIFDADNRVLLAQRPQGRDLAGLWEFPGGKIEPGETRQGALTRELREELGIEIGPARPLTRVLHCYPHKTVLVDFWIVRQFTGEPRGLDGQALQWCTAEALAGVPLLPADRPMLRLIHLPEEITHSVPPGVQLVSSSQQRQPGQVAGALCATVPDAERAAKERADFIVMTERLDISQLERLCESISAPVFAKDISLRNAWLIGASGISML